jgi:hypothetical protein
MPWAGEEEEANPAHWEKGAQKRERRPSLGKPSVGLKGGGLYFGAYFSLYNIGPSLLSSRIQVV